ncbi:MAG TPA: hypothetical protein DEV81_25965 [Cyanobacteria bacterium UBA11049]|nr:hypothetical protein [Cyanobacteria bacterium UBA11049]
MPVETLFGRSGDAAFVYQKAFWQGELLVLGNFILIKEKTHKITPTLPKTNEGSWGVRKKGCNCYCVPTYHASQIAP